MRKFLWGVVLLFCTISVYAQKITASGKITEPNGTPIDGASVVEKGTNNGTTTSAQGTFTLVVSKGAKLVISAIGFEKLEVAASGEVMVSLKATTQDLSEVVVTALGIKREKKALGYAVSVINKKDLAMKPEGDLARVLNGKAPGINIINTSGLSGSGTNIIIRGVSSITGGSTPLFIVDGVPFNTYTNAQAGFDYGNQTSSRFLDLDPNNIENISVLKGLSATTLYGEQGRNGVILITTKNGAAGKSKAKNNITVTQSLFQNAVSNLPDYTHDWGGGFDLSQNVVFYSNWGAKIKSPPDSVAHPYDKAQYNQIFPEYKGAKYAYQFYPSVENFFRKGYVSTTSVNAGGSNGNFSYNTNYSYTDDEGFTPGNRMYRNTFGIGGSGKLSDKTTVSATLNYTLTDVVAPPTGTSFGSGAGQVSVFGDVLYTPVTVDLMNLPYQNPVTGGSVYYRNSNDIQNPRWTVANSFTKDKVNRVFGSAQVKYDLTRHIALTYRLGYDNYAETQIYAQNKGGVDAFATGIYRTTSIINTIWDHTGFVNYNDIFGNDWSLNVDAGINSRENIYTQSGTKSLQQLVYGLFDHSNFIVHDITSESGADLDFTTHDQTIGVFGQAAIGYRDYVFLNLGGRNSWTSTLEDQNRSLFYPSVSASFIPTTAIEALKGSKWINYLKARVGYATSARFPDPYTTRGVLDIATRAFIDRSGTVVNVNSISNLLPNPDLKPELQSEVEAGVEGKFINNRLSFDLTVYDRLAKDQILYRDLDPSTGYTSQQINAGDVRNKGVELSMGYDIFKGRNWTWNITGLYTLNRSKVSNIPDDLKSVVVAGYTNLGNFAINGQPLGIMQGSVITRDAKGQRMIDANGDYVIDPEIGIIGDPNPLYKLTGLTTVTYKSFSFSMQWDYQVGGAFLSLTTASLLARGVTEDDNFDRTLPIILPGVKQDGSPNDIQTSATSAYFDNNFGANELQIYKGTFIKLREASFTYSLPKNVLAKTPFGGISVSIQGSNLWYLAPYFPKHVHFDPETNGLGVSNGRGLEFFTGPSSRRIGASIMVTF